MADRQKKLLSNPYGDVTFANFRAKNRAFVDKTGMIKVLDDQDTPPFPVLLRPRRFGKSTFVQMLMCYYDISFQRQYRKLFSNTAIYKEKHKTHNTYHVVAFDFSKVTTISKEAMLNSFYAAVEYGIKYFVKRYPDCPFKIPENEKPDPVTLFNNFISAYIDYADTGKLFVIIDEYDNFANQLLIQNIELFKAITSTGGLLKEFYTSIKAAAADGRSVVRTFITGVSSVSLDSLTSGFNIARNVTSRECFNDFAGFTEKELQDLIPKLIDTKKLGTTTEELIALMKPVYDGYCFSRSAPNTVFNSSMCLYYLDEVKCQNRIVQPETYKDPGSDHDGNKLYSLFVLAKDDLSKEIIDTYLNGDCYYIDNLSENINLNKSNEYDRTQLISMLYYLGYLTIDPKLSSTRLALKVPNLFMSGLFARCTARARLLSNQIFNDQNLDVSSLLSLHDDISSFARSCTEFLSTIFTNQVLAHMSEMALNLVLYSKLNSMGIYTELQKPLRVVAEGEKFADLVITVNFQQENETTYLFELKYSPKSEATEANIAKLKSRAAEQVETYKSALEFKCRNVKGYALVFAGSDCVFCG